MRLLGQVNRKRGRIGAAAHAVIAGAEAAADQHGDLGHLAVATAVTSLAPCLAMPSASYLPPTMKPEMFCRNSSGMRRWQASSMKCAPFSALSREQHAVVGQDRDRHAPDMREAADQGRAVERLELVELASRRRSARSPRARRRARARRCGTMPYSSSASNFGGARLGAGRCRPRLRPVQRRDDVADDRQRVLVILGDDDRPRPTCGACVIGAAQLLGADHLAGRRLHQRRAGEEDRALVAHDHALVATSPAHRRRPRCSCPSRRRSGRCPRADICAWLKKMRPKWSRSGNTSAWCGRLAPPLSTR